MPGQDSNATESRRGKTSPQGVSGGRQVRGKTRIAVDRSAGQATPGRLAAPVYQTVYRCGSQAAREQLAQTLLLSEWWIRPGDGFCRWMAMVKAARVNSPRVWSRIPQPTILRVKRSSTPAR